MFKCIPMVGFFWRQVFPVILRFSVFSLYFSGNIGALHDTSFSGGELTFSYCVKEKRKGCNYSESPCIC